MMQLLLLLLLLQLLLQLRPIRLPQRLEVPPPPLCLRGQYRLVP